MNRTELYIRKIIKEEISRILEEKRSEKNPMGINQPLPPDLKKKLAAMGAPKSALEQGTKKSKNEGTMQSTRRLKPSLRRGQAVFFPNAQEWKAMNMSGTQRYFPKEKEKEAKEWAKTSTTTKESIYEAVDPKFEKRANEYVEALQNALNKYYDERYKNLDPPQLRIDKGRKFWRIVSVDRNGHGMVHSFLDTRNGDILKAAGWKAPAKGARGNIFDSDRGIKGVGPYGANYIRGPQIGFESKINEARQNSPPRN